ncbi:hypothetical protein E2C01_056849 [Portunus trituberculatus]|uniref:Uncharacterized protein n=1 Tax=Portunus trituberculatus TaxID=210409 RepID=A0A5B7GYU6_PORTR|nr:hypothetical protein [Portunus trituberculatus]
MAPLPSHLSLKLNSIFRLANNSTFDDSDLVLPSPPFSDYFMPTIKVLCNDVFHAVAGLNPRKPYELDEVPPIALKKLLSCLHLAWPNSFTYVYRLLPFLLARNLPTFSLFLKRVTTLILQTKVLRY